MLSRRAKTVKGHVTATSSRTVGSAVGLGIVGRRTACSGLVELGSVASAAVFCCCTGGGCTGLCRASRSLISDSSNE